MNFSEFYPDYFTATILEWKHLLRPDKYKDIIISSLEYLVNDKRIVLYGFVIMSNHIHLICLPRHFLRGQIQQGHLPKDVQQSFMKYTSQMIIKDLRNNHPTVLEHFLVKASDRKYQVWERNPLRVALWNQKAFKQKLDYIHHNPVAAGLCVFEEDYHYSSASFYKKAS